MTLLAITLYLLGAVPTYALIESKITRWESAFTFLALWPVWSLMCLFHMMNGDLEE